MCVLQILERVAVDHPHHTLWVLLALAHANKDEEILTQGQSVKRRGRLATGKNASLETEVGWLVHSYMMIMMINFFYCAPFCKSPECWERHKDRLILSFTHTRTCTRAHTHSLFLSLAPPEGRPGMSDVSLLSRISGLSFDSPFLSPLIFFWLVLLLFLSCHFFANGPFSWLFFQKTQIFFVKG